MLVPRVFGEPCVLPRALQQLVELDSRMKRSQLSVWRRTHSPRRVDALLRRARLHRLADPGATTLVFQQRAMVPENALFLFGNTRWEPPAVRWLTQRARRERSLRRLFCRRTARRVEKSVVVELIEFEMKLACFRLECWPPSAKLSADTKRKVPWTSLTRSGVSAV